jgi:hypothetical protein
MLKGNPDRFYRYDSIDVTKTFVEPKAEPLPSQG